MYLLIDNYDSFTYNLYQAFASKGLKLLVKRNDAIGLDEISRLNPDKIIISPGPKAPEDAGISNDIILNFAREIPILGICLGHQCAVKTFGGTVKKVGTIVHGKTSGVIHDGKGIFNGIPSPFLAARYHSLTTTDIPDCLEVSARTEDGIIMGMRHKEYPLIGLQFHPESFLTETGNRLIDNYIKM